MEEKIDDENIVIERSICSESNRINLEDFNANIDESEVNSNKKIHMNPESITNSPERHSSEHYYQSKSPQKNQNIISNEMNMDERDNPQASSLMNIIENLEKSQSDVDMALVRSAKKKIWKVIRMIKKNKANVISNLNQKKKYIFNPKTSRTVFIVNIIIKLFLLADYFCSPYEYCSCVTEDYLREYIMDTVFLMEIIFTFFVAYYDYNKKILITDMKLIAIHYLKYGFIVDFLAAFPFYAFIFNNKDHENYLLLLRFLKMYRYPSLISDIKVFFEFIFSYITSNIRLRDQIVQIIAFSLSLIYTLHLCACFYVLIGMKNPFKADSNWIAVFETGFYTSPEIDITPLDRYISSLYQICQTFTTAGFGDMHPVNNFEIVFIMFVEIVCCGLFAYLLTCLFEIFTNRQNDLAFKYHGKIDDLHSFIDLYMNNLPGDSKYKNLHRNIIWDDVKKYFEIYYQTDKNFTWINNFPFIQQMKPRHRKELLNRAFFNVKKKYKDFFFSIKNDITKNRIILNLKTQIEKSNTVIQRCHKKFKNIYFIENGRISVLEKDKEITVLNEGDIFCLEGFLFEKSKYTYKVSNNVDFIVLFKINIDFLISEILNYDSETYKEILTIANNQLNYYKDAFSTRSKFNDLRVEDSENYEIIDKHYGNISTYQKEEEEKMEEQEENEKEKEEKGFEDRNVIEEKLGNFPERLKEKKHLEQLENHCNECNERLELINEQLKFLNKYLFNEQ